MEQFWGWNERGMEHSFEAGMREEWNTVLGLE